MPYCWLMNISGEDLKLTRNHLDLTLAEMGEKLGVSQRTVVNWEGKGVPKAKVQAVIQVLGPAIQEAKSVAESYARFLEGQPSAEEENARLAAESEVVDSPTSTSPWDEVDALRGPKPGARRAKLLAPFSDSDLLHELSQRAFRRGDRRRIWNAERVEQFQRYVAPEWDEDADPDYSNMSEEEAKNYGLAAHKGDPNIGPEDDPHET